MAHSANNGDRYMVFDSLDGAEVGKNSGIDFGDTAKIFARQDVFHFEKGYLNRKMYLFLVVEVINLVTLMS